MYRTLVASISYCRTILLMLFIFTSICQAKTLTKFHCNQKDSAAIETTIKRYLDTNSAVSSHDVTILSKRCVGSYASAIVHPKKPITDQAIVYLHKMNNRWKVMSLGTAFDDKFLAQFPKGIRNPAQ